MITFKEKDHEYLYNNTKLTSATTFIAQFMEEFNNPYRSRMSAYKEIMGALKFNEMKSNLFGFEKNPDENILFPIFDEICGKEDADAEQARFIEKWRMSGVNGTKFHLMMENETRQAGGKINPFTGNWCKHIDFEKQFDNQTISLDFSTLEPGIYTEFLAFDKTLPLDRTIVGTMDELFVELNSETGEKECYIDDFKTNESPPKEMKYTKCKKPITHLYENKVTTYKLQSSLYRYMLKTHGLNVIESAFTNYIDYDKTTGKMRKCEFLEKEIIDMKNYAGFN